MRNPLKIIVDLFTSKQHTEWLDYGLAKHKKHLYDSIRLLQTLHNMSDKQKPPSEALFLRYERSRANEILRLLERRFEILLALHLEFRVEYFLQNSFAHGITALTQVQTLVGNLGLLNAPKQLQSRIISTMNMSLLTIKARLGSILQKLLASSFLPLYTIEQFNGVVRRTKGL